MGFELELDEGDLDSGLDEEISGDGDDGGSNGILILLCAIPTVEM